MIHTIQTALTHRWAVAVFSSLVTIIFLGELSGIPLGPGWYWGMLAALWATAPGPLVVPWLRRRLGQASS
jgi:hypothetical protein